MEKHLIISDLDGTLADGAHEVNEETKQIIRRLLDDGHLFYIATGRMKSLVSNVAKSIDERVGVIASNGSVIQTDVGFETFTLNQEDKLKLYEVSKKHKTPALFFTEQDILYTDFVPEFFAIPNEFHTNNVIKQILDPIQDLLAFPIVNCLFMAHHVDNPQVILTPTRKSIVDTLNLTVTSSTIDNLEVYSTQSSKGNALKRIMNLHNIQSDNVISFGDGFNDVSMFEVAKTSVAMGNAPDTIKKIATHTTRTNVENGVSHFLMQYFKY